MRILFAVFFCATVAAAQQPEISIVPIATGLDKPVGIVSAGDSRLFIVEKTGRIVIYNGTDVLPTPFLDIHDEVSADATGDGEHGLLGLVFDPVNTQYFYVDFSDGDGNIEIERFQISDNADRADPTSETLVLKIVHPATARHYGGQLQFGPDGYLYISVGDGGIDGDTVGNAQNTNVLLGKILRIDVSSLPYSIPPTNPFDNEVWAIGLRNPWRFSFDRTNGDMFIADVGQNDWEEVDYAPYGTPGGQNYGWHAMEGDHCFSPSFDCEQDDFTMPILEYGHIFGACSVIGGYRYHGARYPRLVGMYIYGDLCTGAIFGATQQDDGDWDSRQLGTTTLMITSFGQDQNGEIYVADLKGSVYRITDSVESHPRHRAVGK